MSRKRGGLTVLEILLITLIVLAVSLVLVNRHKRGNKVASSQVTKTFEVFEEKSFEEKFGFSRGVGVHSVDYNKQEEVKEQERTNGPVRVEVDLSKVGFSFEDGTNSL